MKQHDPSNGNTVLTSVKHEDEAKSATGNAGLTGAARSDKPTKTGGMTNAEAFTNRRSEAD